MAHQKTGCTAAKTQERRDKAMAMRLEGKSTVTIGKELGVTHQAVSRLLSDAECKAIIDKCHRELVYHAPEINLLFLKDCQSDGKIGLEARKRFQDITGIAPMHSQSYFLQQIFVQGDNGLQDAEFRKLAMSFLGLPAPDAGPESPDLIDVTPVNPNTTD